MRVFLVIILVLAGALVWFFSGGSAGVSKPKVSIDGVSLESPHFVVTDEHIRTLEVVNANWVAIIPYAFSRQGQPEVYFNHERQWWGERADGTAEMIRVAHEAGLKIMLKPHVWMHDHWIGDFWLEEEHDWKLWEKAYAEYVMSFARQADSLDVEMFCVGTEYKLAVKYRPDFWFALVDSVKSVYTGNLTYASNWDNYTNVPFWNSLDFIGVDAYFPLIQQKDAKADELMVAWEPIKEELRQFSEQLDRPVLFAEYGYQSVDGAAGNHWEVSRDPEDRNEAIQAAAYESLYRSFWDEDWFAGGFLWKWHLGDRGGKRRALSFTPQGKKAEKVINNWYGRGDRSSSP